MHPTPSPFRKRNRRLSGGESGAAPEEGRVGRVPEGKLLEARPLHPGVGSPGDGVPVSDLPATSPRGFGSPVLERNGAGMPASRALHGLPGQPAPRPPAPTYLKETERKVLLLRRPSGLGARGSPTESRRPAQPPRANDKLLVGVFRVQVVGPLPRGPGSRRQRPPAARRAARPHSASGGRAPRRPRRREAASRGAGRTTERGAGPAGAPPPHRPPEAGGLIRPQASPPGPARPAGRLPPPGRPLPAPPLRAARRRPLRPSPELAERRVGGGWVWGSAAVPTRFSAFPSGGLCPRPLWSGGLLIYTPLSTPFLFPLPYPSQQVRAKI
ncbi:translation initiation factor IF-2-like [Moschus berezovskii]|uniref:translation initiation factor IF-2-like n=1 Tax=Moschus berezovskii TaxID=68408 RepID=UPI0024442482|nr:translation initiation factor IF-2-like [Moschus berezovskii]